MMIIAEIGLNHNGNMQLARCLIEEAAAAGADVAKFQFSTSASTSVPSSSGTTPA